MLLASFGGISSLLINQIRNGRNFNTKLNKKRRNLPTHLRRYTDIIKHLCILLVKHERVLTTSGRANMLYQYANMLIDLVNRENPPPDLEKIENGFILQEHELDIKLTTRALKHGKNRKVKLRPPLLSPEEFRTGCDQEIRNVLLNDDEAISKLYNEIAPRMKDLTGNYALLTYCSIPKRKYWPQLSYVEYKFNKLPPPDMPTVIPKKIILPPGELADKYNAINKSNGM